MVSFNVLSSKNHVSLAFKTHKLDYFGNQLKIRTIFIKMERPYLDSIHASYYLRKILEILFISFIFIQVFTKTLFTFLSFFFSFFLAYEGAFLSDCEYWEKGD